MSVKIRTTHEVNIPGTEVWFVPDGPTPDPYETLFVEKTFVDGATWRVSWMVSDDIGRDHDWQEGAIFQEFRTEWDRDDFISDMIAEHGEDRVVIVDRYEHGLVHYSPRQSRFYPDRQWDVAPCAVLVVPDDVFVDDGQTFRDACLAYATAALEEYSSWCNGDVWGVVHNYVTVDGKVVDADACWGYIGHDHAEQAAKEGW